MKGREAEGGVAWGLCLKWAIKARALGFFFKKGERREALDATGELPTTECAVHMSEFSFLVVDENCNGILLQN